jgi:hypothetical protein
MHELHGLKTLTSVSKDTNDTKPKHYAFNRLYRER